MRNLGGVLLLMAVSANPLLADFYRVTIDAGSPRVARVNATLTPSAGEIRLDRDAADTGLLHGWSTFVHRLTVADATGRRIDASFAPPGRWRLQSAVEDPVTVSYELLLQHDRFPSDPGYDELAYATERGVFWTGRALFVEGAPSADVEVQFELPAGWRAVTPWAPLADGARFRPRDTDALLDSGFVAGTQVVSTVDDAGRIQIALAGEHAVAQQSALESLVGAYFDSFSRLFGAAPDGRLLLVAADGSFWGGGVVGSTISMILGGAVDETTLPILSFVTVHELFHLWNAAFPVADDDLPDLYWFSEGTATYYAFRAAWGRGDLDEATLLGRLAEEHRKDLESSAGQSLAAAGAAKLEQYDRVYSGGLMATLGLDLLIRSRTAGTRSLDDVLRALDVRRRTPGAPPVSLATLSDVVREATGVNVHEFVARHIAATEPPPIEQLLATVGIVVEGDGAGGVRWRRAEPAGDTATARWRALRTWSVEETRRASP